jgi:hypothetical protein
MSLATQPLCSVLHEAPDADLVVTMEVNGMALQLSVDLCCGIHLSLGILSLACISKADRTTVPRHIRKCTDAVNPVSLQDHLDDTRKCEMEPLDRQTRRVKNCTNDVTLLGLLHDSCLHGSHRCDCQLELTLGVLWSEVQRHGVDVEINQSLL